MAKVMRQLIPDAATLVAMHPAELGGYVLEVLLSLGEPDRGQWNRRNFCGQMANAYSENIRLQGPNQGVAAACAEAWSWLEVNLLICGDPGQDGWYVATRRGRELGDRVGVRTLIEASELPQHFLHESFTRDVRPLFLQGRYDTAVFEAFRLVEVAVRDAAGLGMDLVGVKLAARAFHPEDGDLADMNAEAGERVALMNLMVGALGSYKNPQSHRHVGVEAPEAREMIVMASHLLKIVDARRPISLN